MHPPDGEDAALGTVGLACGAVVLAAGEARRFGAPKVLMPFGETTVLGSVVQAIASAGVKPVIVVAGANIEAVKESLTGQPIVLACNPDTRRGMLASIRIGLDALPGSLDRFLIALGDQPRIRAEDLSHLLREHSRSGKGITIPVYQGRRGHPVIFSARYRAEIGALTEQQTLRDLIDSHGDDIEELGCDSDAYVCDIDTREEYERELRKWQSAR